jgi:hypothetical protein
MHRPQSRIEPLRGALALFAALTLAAGFAATLRASEAEAMPALKTGVSYVYGNEPLEFQHVVATGSKLVLKPINWWDVAPKQLPASWNPEDPADPNYKWHFYDVWVSNALAAGLTPVLQVRGAPNWAQNCPVPFFNDSPCKPDPTALAAFSKAAAERYSGRFQGLPRVRYWQGLNEPNLSIFFNPQYENGKAVSATLYRTLINSFYTAIKSVDRSNIVIAAGLGPIAVPKYTIGPMQFTRELLCMNGRNRRTAGNCDGGVHFDIFDMHPYTTGGPTHKGGVNDVELGDIAKLQRLLRAADRQGRIKGKFKRTPLWITELAWDSKPPDPGGLPMRIESQWIAEALYRSWKAGVNNFFWFSLVDFAPEGLPFNASLESGLYFWAPKLVDQRPKPIIAAFRFPFVAFPRGDGLLVWGRTPSSRGGRVAIQAQRGKRWRNIGVVRAGANGMFGTVLKSRYGGDKRGSVRARFVNGASTPFPMRPVGDFYHPPFGSLAG